jgi:hypothetical protein
LILVFPVLGGPASATMNSGMGDHMRGRARFGHRRACGVRRRFARRDKRRHAWLALAVVVGLAAPARGQDPAPIPEPDITYFGSVPAGSQIAIEHAAGALDSATAGAAAPYVLSVKLVQPVVVPKPALPPAGNAYVGDTATVLVNGVAQGRVTLAERGAIFRLDIPNPATTPSPNAILSPVEVEPTVPALCGAVSCTPTVPRVGTPTPTRTGGGTGTPNPSGTPTPTPTPTATPAAASCIGDCGGDGSVTIDELVRSVNIALGNTAVAVCTASDRNGNGAVTIDELVTAVGAALNGCPRVVP